MREWKGKSRGGAFGYAFFIFLIKKLGVRFAYFFLAFIVLYFIPFAPKATRSIWNYSYKILKKNRWQSVLFLFRNYYRFGQVLIDRVAIGNGMQDKYRFDFKNFDDFLHVLNADTPVMILGGHIGNWEAGIPYFDKYGKKINIILYDAEYQSIKKILEKNKMPSDFKVIPIKKDDISHVIAIKHAIDNNEYICMQGDRIVRDERSFTTTFCGAEAAFPSGPFQLAARINSPVVIYFAMRERGMKYRFYFTVIDKEKNTGKSAVQQLSKIYIEEFEKVLMKYPEQWFNYYNFWKSK